MSTSPTSEFEFVSFSRPEGSRWDHYDYCVRLRESSTKKHADMMYSLKNSDNFVILSNEQWSKEDSDKLAVAAFCYLSVIVK